MNATELMALVVGEEQTNKEARSDDVRGRSSGHDRDECRADGPHVWPELRRRSRSGGSAGRHRSGAARKPTDAPGPRLSLARRTLLVVVSACLFATTGVVLLHTSDLVLISYWAVGVFVIVTCLGLFVRGHSYTHLPMASGKVLAIIPAYN